MLRKLEDHQRTSHPVGPVHPWILVILRAQSPVLPEKEPHLAFEHPRFTKRQVHHLPRKEMPEVGTLPGLLHPGSRFVHLPARLLVFVPSPTSRQEEDESPRQQRLENAWKFKFHDRTLEQIPVPGQGASRIVGPSGLCSPRVQRGRPQAINCETVPVLSAKRSVFNPMACAWVSQRLASGVPPSTF